MTKQSKLIVEARDDIRKHHDHKPMKLVLATHVNKGKVYPYNSVKRGWPVQTAMGVTS